MLPRVAKIETSRITAEKILSQRIQENTKASEQAGQFLRLLVLVGTALTILAIVLFGLWAILPIRRQLPKVVHAAENIAAGDLTQPIMVTQDKSEIGQLMVAFQRMEKHLHSLIYQTQKSGVQISTSVTQIAAAGKQLEATVAEQLASTNEVTANAHQIAASARELVNTMEQVAELSQSTALAAGASQEDLTHMESVMRKLSEATQSIATKFGVMSEKASNINSVVTAINKVADQTNLLSLNAAIEAEKAGEYGAGFAVVAREIRRLADQTAVATLEIAQMIKEMQSAVSTGVVEMDKFNQSMVLSVADVGRISDQIARVIHQVQGLTPQFDQVNQTMEEQSLGAQQISEAMEQLSEASQQTADALRETNQALEGLDGVAHGLRSEIARFRTA
ncbi:methyl-accepting chemotaxis protein [Neosynechococcus sphagnicola]|uniref:methyl-accepting chemotaxis protein n=1 Tax=Neosynechococcus sphagnicola TaxID=1501145 RepID=UPI000A883DA1|nr:methyl-accepting chemotaxis protein [Neosynechococcus sphagnicola]